MNYAVANLFSSQYKVNISQHVEGCRW